MVKLIRTFRTVVIGAVVTLSLLTPTQADKGDAFRFEAALQHISRLAKSRPSIESLLDTVRRDLPALKNDSMTVSDLSQRMAQTQDPDLPVAVLRSLLGSLDDRWARLYTPQQSRSMRAGLEGDGDGILGVNLVADAERDRGFLISDIAPNGPSQGVLFAGERLQAIDGHDLRDPASPSLDSLLHGVPGSRARVQVTDRRGQSRLEVIERVDLDAPTAYVTASDSTLTEIRITSFGAQTATELRQILQGGVSGSVVLDLRCNGGGYVKSAVDCASLFIEDGSLVVTVESPDRNAVHLSQGQPIYDGNICLLVNSKTASAAEIFASCLADHLGAKLIGERTYGKGSVQRIVDLPGDWALKVTTSAYRTADGALIDGVGLTPDLLLEMPLEACRTEGDTQLAQARLHLGTLAARAEWNF